MLQKPPAPAPEAVSEAVPVDTEHCFSAELFSDQPVSLKDREEQVFHPEDPRVLFSHVVLQELMLLSEAHLRVKLP